MIGAWRALAVLLGGAWCAQGEPSLRWVTGGERVTVEVSGLSEAALASARSWPAEQARKTFPVRVLQNGAPAMLGAYQAEAGVLRFVPQFALTPGVAYRAEFDPAGIAGGGSGNRLAADFTVPVRPREAATVVRQIYPSGEVVPENLLKFYLHFSGPMSRGHIYEHIHLRDEQGRDVELPFLEIDEELWDPGMTRLTLFIDPGRIKREVRPLEEIGPALQAGRRFTLVIDAGWHDAAGHPLGNQYGRAFRVGPPDRVAITPAEWKFTSPAAGTRGMVRVDFGESMDHALALRLRVIGSGGKTVAGAAALAEEERVWTFTPDEAWQSGPYELEVPAILEDLAGNNVGKAFEVELLERGERAQDHKPVRVPFAVK